MKMTTMMMMMLAMKGVGLKRRDATILWSENLSNLTTKDASFCFVLNDDDQDDKDNWGARNDLNLGNWKINTTIEDEDNIFSFKRKEDGEN